MIKYEILRFVFKMKHQKFRNGKGCDNCDVLAPALPCERHWVSDANMLARGGSQCLLMVH